MATREDVRRLVEELPEEALEEARRLLESLRARTDPLLRALAEAPEDDEPLSAEDLEAIREGREDAAAGRLLTTPELKRALEEQG